MFQQILVLWDGSELAEQALDIATNLGDAYDAEITAVCVVRPQQGAGHHRTHPHRGTPLAPDEQAERLFAERHPDNQTGSRHCRFRVVRGSDVTAALLEHAYEHGSDLIVVGHHRDPGSSHRFAHSLTDSLVAGSQLPVMVVSG